MVMVILGAAIIYASISCSSLLPESKTKDPDNGSSAETPADTSSKGSNTIPVASPGSTDSLACIADLLTKVTGTWQPLAASEYSSIEMRSVTMVATDPDKYIRLYFSRNGQWTEVYCAKPETTCAKTDSTFTLFQSGMAADKSLSVTIKNETSLNVDFKSSSSVQKAHKFNLDVGNKKPVM